MRVLVVEDERDTAEALDSGADDYLPKPFSYPVLLAHLRSLTRRTLGARPAVLAAAGLRWIRPPAPPRGTAEPGRADVRPAAGDRRARPRLNPRRG